MSYCSRCGHELGEGAKFCQYCGNPINSYVNNNFQQTFNNPFQENKKRNSYNGMLSIIFAFLIPFVGLIFGIIGMRSDDIYDKKSAKIGLILSIIMLIIQIVIFVLYIVLIINRYYIVI